MLPFCQIKKIIIFLKDILSQFFYLSLFPAWTSHMAKQRTSVLIQGYNGSNFSLLTLAFKLLIFPLPSPSGMSLQLPRLVSTLRKKLLSGSS